jgi:hypothetical protein
MRCSRAIVMFLAVSLRRFVIAIVLRGRNRLSFPLLKSGKLDKYDNDRQFPADCAPPDRIRYSLRF